MASSPDLFVVCKNCGAEVSPYITECPYCGTRLRKRAPKIERDGTVSEPKPKPKPKRKPAAPKIPKRPGPSAPIGQDRRPYATLALVLASVFGYVLFSLVRDDVAVIGPIGDEWWRVVTSPFVYSSAWYELAAVAAIGLFGWLLERRHNAFVVLALFLLCGAGGIALTAAVDPTPIAIGGNGAALGLLGAWVVPDLLSRARGQEYEGDLLGSLVIAVVVLLMPLATDEASAIAGFAGGAVGLLCGLVLSRVEG